MIYKSQQQTNDRRQSESYQQPTNINDHKQRYQTINTASIPPSMSVQSDINTAEKLHYNNRYNYSNEHYQQQRPTNNTHSKCGGAALIQNQQQRQLTFNGSGSNHNNFPHYSISDNNQKEGEA
ncbi:unnamed protein product [Adineta steineri]|uniref:Uncharacterized protein n=1 Tax=Adineta steineri TaxID=433720 RepID=A0A814LZ21_9BILA|nr:unnamed protein product [Adineta steineri]